MPSATPGPSALGRNVNAGVIQGRSGVVKKKEDKDKERQKALKRPSSGEPLDEEEKERKKAKFVEDFDDDDATGAKDTKEKKRKKKKKRKRPISVVAAGSSDTSQQDVMGIGCNPSSETLVNGSHGQSSRSLAVEVDIVNGVKVEDDADDEAPTCSSSDKGKGRAKPDPPAHDNPNPDDHNLGSGSAPVSDTRSTTLEGPDQSSEIARLKEQLAEQHKLLEKHQSHLNLQQQALTCQICLELLYRPYALIPCGHVTCYGCLVRWFTSDLNAEEPTNDEEQERADEEDRPNSNDPNVLLNTAAARRGSFVRRRKTCPVCRGVVPDRPVEMWDIKQMVAALVKSHLVDLPVPPGEVGEDAHGNNTPNDPWRNLFRPGRGHHRHGGPPPPGQADDEQERTRFGWYDHEDGGVYRCIQCHHELWGGMCTGCERIYPGHEPDEDDDDSDEEDDFVYHDDDTGALQWAGYMYLDELRRLHEEDYQEDDDEDEEVEVVDDYNGEYFLDGPVDDEQGEWSVRGDADADADADIESSDGFIDDEERMRSGGLSGVGDGEMWTRETSYISEDGSEEDAGSDLGRWAGGRNLRNNLEEDEGTSLDEGLGLGWGEDISGDDTDDEIRRSPAPSLRRSTHRRIPVVESDATSSGVESETDSPPRRIGPRLRWALRRRVVESDSEDEADHEVDGPLAEDDEDEDGLRWVEYYHMRNEMNGR